MNDQRVRSEIKKVILLCIVGILVLELLRYIPDFSQWMHSKLFRKVYILLGLLDLFGCHHLILRKVKRIEQPSKFEMLFLNNAKFLTLFGIVFIGMTLLVA